MKKIILFFLLILVASVSTLADVVESGSCGANATYTLNDDGTLYISGTGAISGQNAWRSKAVVAFIAEGITSFDSYAFANCPNLIEIHIPGTVTNIARGCFENTAFKRVYMEDGKDPLTIDICHHYSSGVTYPGAFYDSSNSIEYIYLGRNLSYDAHPYNYGSAPFESTNKLEKLDIGPYVTEIGHYMFKNHDMETVVIPNQITYLGHMAFHSSTMKTLIVGSGVKTIATCGDTNLGWNNIPYQNVYPLKTIWLGTDVPSNSENIRGTINYAINSNFSRLKNCHILPYLNSCFIIDGIRYVPTDMANRYCDIIDGDYEQLSTINVKDEVTYKGVNFKVNNIYDYSFQHNNSIENVEISILGTTKNYAFANCKNLQSIKINSPSGFENNVFDQCTSLKNIDFNTEGNIGNSVFASCSTLEDITIADGVEQIGSHTFEGCTSLKNVTFNNSLVSIGDYCFSGCGALENIELTESITKLGSFVFNACKDLKNIKWGRNIKQIPKYAFYGCKSLQSFNIKSTVDEVSSYAFWECYGLKYLTIEDRTSILKLGSSGSSSLFCHCPLDSVYLGGDISYTANSSNGYSPFYGNQYLTKVKTGSNVTSINAFEFGKCSNLHNISLGCNIAIIGANAFLDCQGLHEITLGRNVNHIYDAAFANCSELKSMICHAKTPPICETHALTDINKFECTLRVYENSISNYQQADQWQEFFFTETFPAQYQKMNYFVNDTLYKSIELEYIYDDVVIPEDPRQEGYVFTGWSEIPDTVPAYDYDIYGYLYLIGDVTGDELINVKDISGVIRIILGTDHNLHNIAADVNADESVDVVDVSNIGYYILNDEFPRPKASAMGYADDAPALLYMDDFTITPGEEKQVNLYLVQNGNGITSMQFDLRLPDGITLQDDEDCIMANKTDNPKHNVMWSRQQDGSIRIVDYSSANKTFSDGEHVLTLTLVADADMEEDTSHILSMDNVIMSTSDFKRQTSTAQSIVTIGSNPVVTDLSAVRDNTNGSRGIYDVLGRKLNKPVKGINIINGKKVIIK